MGGYFFKYNINIIKHKYKLEKVGNNNRSAHARSSEVLVLQAEAKRRGPIHGLELRRDADRDMQ